MSMTLPATGKPVPSALSTALTADKWLLLSLVVGAMAVAKGVRLPNDWSATQMQVDYSLGFVKRGLAGEIAGLLQIPIYRYHVFAVVSFAVLALALGLLVVLVRRSLADPEFKLYLPVFASSMAVSFMVHCVGYLDILLLAALLAALLTTSPRFALPVAAVASVTGVLIHEMFLLSFLPVLLLRIGLDALLVEGAERRRHIVYGFVLLAVVGVITVIVSLAKPMTPGQVEALKAAIGSRVDFQLRADFFVVLQRSLGDNIGTMLWLFKSPQWWIHEAIAAVALLWVAIFFVARSIDRIRTRSDLDNPMVVVAVVAASLAPASLQLLGWDIYRWYALAALNAFLVYAIVTRAVPRPERAAAPALGDYQLVALMVAVNMATSTGYFDDFVGNTFPYVERILRG